MQTLRLPLRVVFYREDDQWIAHCLEFDIMGHGETKQAALSLLAKAIEIQVEQSIANDNPRDLFAPADGKFFRMFAAGVDVVECEVDIPLPSSQIRIESTQLREYSENGLVSV